MSNIAAETALLPHELSERRVWLIPLFLLMFATFIELLDISSFTPVMPLIMKAWGMNGSQLGLFAGMVGLAGLFVSIPMGELIKRIGIKYAVIIALTSVLIGLVIIAESTNFSRGIVGRVFATAGYRAGSVALYAGIALVAPKRMKASMMGIMLALASVSSIIGTPLMGNVIAAHWGWTGVFWAMAGLTAFGLVLFLLFFRLKIGRQTTTTPQERQAAVATEGPGVSDVSPYKQRMAWQLMITNGLLSAGATVVFFFVPVVLAMNYGWKTPAITNMVTLCWVFALPGQLLTGPISDRVGRKPVVLACAIPIVPLALLLNYHNANVVAGAAIAIIALILWANPPLQTAPADMFSRRQMSVVYGMMATGLSASAYFMPQISGWLKDWTGNYTSGFYFLAGIAALCVVSISFLRIDAKR
jgi:predicted MFS family arabinose efflux permease